MSRLIVFVCAVICFVNAEPADSEIISTTEAEPGQAGVDNVGTWQSMFPQFPQIPRIQFPKMQLPQFQWPQTPKPISAQDIANMKPAPGGIVSGIAQSVSGHVEYVNGKPVVKTQGQTIWNKNGVVKTETFGNYV